MFTPEDEIDELHRELGTARRRLDSIERAPKEGRWCRSKTDWLDAVETQRDRIGALERDLAGAQADQFAAASGFAA